MRDGEQNSGKTAPAQIRKDRLRALTESKRGIVDVRALQETTGKEHERHEADPIDRRPKMQFD